MHVSVPAPYLHIRRDLWNRQISFPFHCLH